MMGGVREALHLWCGGKGLSGVMMSGHCVKGAVSLEKVYPSGYHQSVKDPSGTGKFPPYFSLFTFKTGSHVVQDGLELCLVVDG